MNHSIEVEFSVLRCVGTAKDVFLFENYRKLGD